MLNVLIRAETNVQNFREAVKEKQQLQKQKKQAEFEMRKAKILAERCLAKQENVVELKKTLHSTIRAREEQATASERERQQYVQINLMS